jgi:hypothetical protein
MAMKTIRTLLALAWLLCSCGHAVELLAKWSRIWNADPFGAGAYGVVVNGTNDLVVCGTIQGFASLSSWTGDGQLTQNYFYAGTGFYDIAGEAQSYVYCGGRAIDAGYDFPFAVKFDRTGVHYFAYFDGTTSTATRTAWGIAVAGSNVYLTGYTNQSNSTSRTDMFLTKLTTDGNLVWRRVWGSQGNYFDLNNDVWIDAAGDVYCVGQTEGRVMNGVTNNYDVTQCLTKWTPDGSCLWTRLWGSVDFDSRSGIAGDGTNMLFVCGVAIEDFDGQTNAGGSDLCLSAFSLDGTPQWTRIWGSPANDGALRLLVAPSNGFLYVTGYAAGAIDGQEPAGGSDLCLTVMDAHGTRLVTRLWGSVNNDEAKAVAGDDNGAVYVCGYTTGAFDGQPNTGNSAQCLTKFMLVPEPCAVAFWAAALGVRRFPSKCGSGLRAAICS